MLSKRVIVVAGDRPLQKRLIAGAMAAGGAVQAFAGLDELAGRVDAELVLCALRQPGDPAFAWLTARLPEGAQLIPVIPTPQLEWMVVLLGDPRVATVLSAEELSTATISSTVAKLLYGDLFGVEKHMPWGVRIYSVLVSDYNEKSLAIASVGDFGQAMGVRRKYREQINQCIDEMLMNALYDAPVDESGKPLFAEVPVRDRVLLKSNEKAVLQYACDGDRFVVSVRDGFGSLKKATVLAYLDKCLHAQGADQIDRKAGGAGLGLYLIANAATEIYFHIFDGSATEVVCSFDLSAPRSQLRVLGIHQEAIDTAQRAASGTQRTLPARRGRRREDLGPTPRAQPMLPVMMGFALLLLAAAVALVAMPYLRQPPAAALRIESEPPGATVFVDGRTRGVTPLRIDGLEAGRSYAVRSTMPGRAEDDQLVTAAAGESVVRLRLPGRPGLVAVESDPPGAHLVVDGKDSGKVTPAQLDLQPGQSAELVLKKDGFLDQKLSLTGPPGGERAVYRSALPVSPLVATLTIEVEPPSAAVTVDGMAMLPPGATHDAFITPDAKHTLRVSAPGFIDHHEELILHGGEHRTVHAGLAEGGMLAVKTAVAARVFVDDKPVGATPLQALALPAGRHRLALRAQKPFLRFETNVLVEKGQTVEKSLGFGTVEVTAAGVLARPAGADKGVTELLLPPGPHKLALVNKDGEKKSRDVVVELGAKLVIDTW